MIPRIGIHNNPRLRRSEAARLEAWTQAHRLAEWWGPKGLTMKVAKLDLRPGGTFHYSIATPDGMKCGESSFTTR